MSTNNNWPQHSYFTAIRKLITRQRNQQLQACCIEAHDNRTCFVRKLYKVISYYL